MEIDNYGLIAFLAVPANNDVSRVKEDPASQSVYT